MTAISENGGSNPTEAPERRLSTKPTDPPPFSALGMDEFRALPTPARTMLLALWREAGGRPYDHGYAALAESTGKGLRTVERVIGTLKAAGFVQERPRRFGDTKQLVLHPGTRAFTIAEMVAPAGSKASRARALPLRLRADSTALRCAAVRRPDGSRYLPVPYVVDLMTEHERAVCAHASAIGAEAVCEDVELSDALFAWFRHLAWWDRNRAGDLAYAALVRERKLRDDVPHHVEDAA